MHDITYALRTWYCHMHMYLYLVYTSHDLHHNSLSLGLLLSEGVSLFLQVPYRLFTFSITYEPVFTITPNTSLIQLCNNEFFCLFDAIVTGDIGFGLATLTSVMEANRVEDLIQPG